MARLRLQNPDAFSRSASLRDQFQTLDGALPPAPKPTSLSEQLALQNFYRSAAKDAVAAEGRLEEESQKQSEQVISTFESSFANLQKAQFKKPKDSLIDDASFEDEFAKPEDRGAALSFLELYGPKAGVSIPTEKDLASVGATELRRLTGEVYRKFYSKLLSKRGPVPGAAGPTGLNISAEGFKLKP